MAKVGKRGVRGRKEPQGGIEHTVTFNIVTRKDMDPEQLAELCALVWDTGTAQLPASEVVIIDSYYFDVQRVGKV